MRARIIGMGEWYPDYVRENSDWPAEFAEKSLTSNKRELVDLPSSAEKADRLALEALARESSDPFLGTTRRRVASDELTSCEAGALAAKAALEDAGVAPQQVDLVTTWDLVPDRITPAAAPKVATLVGASNAFAWGIDAACASIVAQLELSSALIESGRIRYALAVQSHLATRTFPLSHPASPNVGDGATAILIGPSEVPGLKQVWSKSHGEYWDAVVWLRGRQEDPPWWQSGDAFYLGSQQPGAAQDLIVRTVRFGADTVKELTAKARIQVEDIDVIASVHPRKWVPGAIAEVLGLPADVAPCTFSEVAHLGASGVVSNLLEARRLDLLRPGANVVLYAQGAGFSRAAALLQW